MSESHSSRGVSEAVVTIHVDIMYKSIHDNDRLRNNSACSECNTSTNYSEGKTDLLEDLLVLLTLIDIFVWKITCPFIVWMACIRYSEKMILE